MHFYGVALLALCYLTGKYLGTYLGQAMGINKDVGGVGIAMLLLLGSTFWLKTKGLWKEEGSSGIKYWASLYIPVVIAMAASLNVNAAIGNGLLAILGGFCATAFAFLILKLWLDGNSRK